MVNPQRGIGRVLLIVPGFKFQGIAPAATQGVAYSFLPSITGGVGPFTVTVVTGSLPGWASLNASTGAVTGANPNVLATTNFTLRVTDSSTPTPQTRDLPVSITVSAPLVLTNSPATTAGTSSSYLYLPTTTGGRAPIAWVVVAKPAWAAFAGATGQLSGTTPGTPETDTGIKITGTDADGRQVTTGFFQIAISSGAMAAINALEIMGPSSLDPQGTGPWGFQGNGALIRMNFNATTSAAISDIDVSLMTFTLDTLGNDNNGGAGPFAAVRRIITFKPRAVLRRQPQQANPGITSSTQLFIQGGSPTNAPSVGVATDVYLVSPLPLFVGDILTLSVSNGWNGVGSTAGAGPAITNSSTLDDLDFVPPLYGFVNPPMQLQTADTPVELQVSQDSAGWIGGSLGTPQAVAGVRMWATDGANLGTAVDVYTPVLSNIQTLNGICEVFRATPPCAGVNDTDGSDTMGTGVAWYDAIIYRWRGKPYQISVKGVPWNGAKAGTAQPGTIHPFVKDYGSKYGGAWAPCVPGGLLTGASTAGIMTANPSTRPLVAAAYGKVEEAAKALALWFNSTAPVGAGGVSRVASPILHNNPHGGNIVLYDNTSADTPWSMTVAYTPASVGNCFCRIIPYQNNTFDAYYDITGNLAFNGGFLRLDVRLNKNGGSLRFGDGADGSVTSMVMLTKNITWAGAATGRPVFEQVGLAYLYNVTMISPNINNGVGSSLGKASSGTLSGYRVAKAIGVSYGDATSFEGQFIPYHAVGVVGKLGNNGSAMEPDTTHQTTNDGAIVYNCQFLGFTPAVLSFASSGWTYVRGYCVWQCVFAGVAAGGNNVGFQTGSTTTSVNNLIWGFNTGAHDPADTNATLQSDDRNGFSLLYRDATVCLGSTGYMTKVGNLAPRYATKGAFFTIATNSQLAGNIGNFTVRYGQNTFYNCELIKRPATGAPFAVPTVVNNLSDANQFDWRIADANTKMNYGIATWVNNQSGSGGTGFGDYRLLDQASGGNNVGKGIVPAGGAWNKWDGIAFLRKNAAGGVTGLTGAAGAFEATD